MRRFSANYIYPVNGSPFKNGIVEINDNGEVLNVIDTKGELRESRNLEFYNGIITPGFVNTHCHLELSELKDELLQNKGLPNFLNDIVNYKRKEKSDNSAKSIELYDSLMRRNGIVAIGDISNTGITIKIKKSSRIYYHTFVEALGLGDNSNEIFESNKKLFKDFNQNELRASIVPHSPYSVSKELFQKIKEFSEASNAILSIHNQESDSENQIFIDKSGDLVKFFEKIGIDLKEWKPTGKNSLESIIGWLPQSNNILFVHNTYSKKADIELVNKKFKNAYWCLCPTSNLYIENKLPEIKLFAELAQNVTLGTDSLASNTSLSILDEMKIIIKNYDDFNFEKLLSWGTLNGAKALKIDNKFGSIERGKAPGLNLISNFDFEKMNITEKSEVKVLI
ncbi:MAG: amidohydrolase family protein [Bacteroidales bacterium]|jgi:cytosine/adenosine deaminase-related metal-dependent hydrolase|nr:amidohydrolase family protein [Bacteroidales bacterium]